MNNLDEDIKIVKEIIKCDGCRFATCEQCEINWTQVNAISNVLSVLKNFKKDEENWKKIYEEEEQNIIEKNNKIFSLETELETYKKIAEKLADKLRYEKGMKQDYMFCVDVCGDNWCDDENCKQCIIDWARKEVENEKNNSNT